MELPRVIQIGYGVIREVGSFLARFSPKRILIISGPIVWARVGEMVEDALKREEFRYRCIEVDHSTKKEVEDAVRVAKEFGADLIIGLGGGRAVDVAKLTSYYCGVIFVSLPTSASHDGIASPLASIKGGDRPYSYMTKPPTGVLADVNIIAEAPPKLLAAGCGDLIAKITAVRDWMLARDEKQEYFGKYAANLALLSAEIVLSEAKGIGSGSKEYVRDVVEALISAGVAAGIAGSSRPCSGAEHLFSHALDIIAPNVGLHGEKCGLGAVMMAKLHNLDWEKLRDALRDVKAPVTATELGLSADQIAKALVLAPDLRPERYTILHKIRLSYEQAKALAKDVGVI
ncbi:MAG: iron-containing alcohol dehydrogenase [Thaumarchaeota archaeon]|jgi:glycerol-1-phosphate dehydrogenase [NAD(P)+]|nr:iron-containing alcohol dehydrogenase [Nitrososphaerota archaeon]